MCYAIGGIGIGPMFTGLAGGIGIGPIAGGIGIGPMVALLTGGIGMGPIAGGIGIGPMVVPFADELSIVVTSFAAQLSTREY